MKKMILLLAGLVVVAAAFADEARYNALLSQAKDFEAKKQYVYAMGAYWDAMEEQDLENIGEAFEAFSKIESVIKSGKPGFDEYDDFSLYDNWVLLLKDFEKYWTENAAKTFYIGELKKGDIDRASRTASYSVSVELVRPKKFKHIFDTMNAGLKVSRKSDWDAVKYWPELSAYSLDFKEGTYLYNGTALFYQNADEIEKASGGYLDGDFYWGKSALLRQPFQTKYGAMLTALLKE